ncbi:hypothetical protein TPR58_10795 [Sphingomonas sp. HF-S3]|uniref:WYL domain-containing protein n=1 Tax=Sphingomonas rustica TaxID=3103142 RepID=A0ABV0B9I3_9SPHN
MNWPQIAPDFEYDGSWRDICILDASRREWALVWQVLSADPDRLSISYNGEATTPPADIKAVFRRRQACGAYALYRIGKIRLNCHFLSEEEVEFDFDPRDIDGPAEAARLEHFLAMLGRATSREVRLTAENLPDAIIARYDPALERVLWCADA